MKAGSLHVMPVDGHDVRDHVFADCWCEPRGFRKCPECDAVDGAACWNCDEGFVDSAVFEADLVVHNCRRHGDAPACKGA